MVQESKKNLADVVSDLKKEGFIEGTDVFNSITQGRLKSYTTENCPHPEYVWNGPYLLCTQCGNQVLT